LFYISLELVFLSLGIPRFGILTKWLREYELFNYLLFTLLSFRLLKTPSLDNQENQTEMWMQKVIVLE